MTRHRSSLILRRDMSADRIGRDVAVDAGGGHALGVGPPPGEAARFRRKVSSIASVVGWTGLITTYSSLDAGTSQIAPGGDLPGWRSRGQPRLAEEPPTVTTGSHIEPPWTRLRGHGLAVVVVVGATGVEGGKRWQSQDLKDSVSTRLDSWRYSFAPIMAA